MRVLAVILTLMPGATLADDWVALKGAGIATALTARVLQYEGGAVQNFFADGRTLCEAPGVSWGRWQVQGAQYCSVWPPSDRWTCYDVAQRGLEVRFGADVVGHYVDLH